MHVDRPVHAGLRVSTVSQGEPLYWRTSACLTRGSGSLRVRRSLRRECTAGVPRDPRQSSLWCPRFSIPITQVPVHDWNTPRVGQNHELLCFALRGFALRGLGLPCVALLFFAELAAHAISLSLSLFPLFVRRQSFMHVCGQLPQNLRRQIFVLKDAPPPPFFTPLRCRNLSAVCTVFLLFFFTGSAGVPPPPCMIYPSS